MPGRHRPGKHSEKGVKAKEFYKITPVKAPVQAPKEKPKGSTKGARLTPSDTDVT